MLFNKIYLHYADDTELTVTLRPEETAVFMARIEKKGFSGSWHYAGRFGGTIFVNLANVRYVTVMKPEKI